MDGDITPNDFQGQLDLTEEDAIEPAPDNCDREGESVNTAEGLVEIKRSSTESNISGIRPTFSLSSETNLRDIGSTSTLPLIVNVSGIIRLDDYNQECSKRETFGRSSLLRERFIKNIGTVITSNPSMKESFNSNQSYVSSFTAPVRNKISIFQGKPTKKLGKLFISLHHKLSMNRWKIEAKHQMHLNDKNLIGSCSETRKRMLDKARSDILIVITEGKLFGKELLSIRDENLSTAIIEDELVNRHLVASSIEIEAYSDKIPVHLFVRKLIEQHGTIVFCVSTCLICLKFLTLLTNSNIKHLVLRLDKMGVYGDSIYDYIRDEYSWNLPSNIYFHGAHLEFVRKCYSVIEKNTDTEAIAGLFPDTYDLIVIGGTSVGLQTIFEARLLGLKVCLIDSPLKPAASRPVIILGNGIISDPNASKKILCYLLSLRNRGSKYNGHYSRNSLKNIQSDWKELAESARRMIERSSAKNVSSIHNFGAGFLRCGVKFVDRRTVEITNSRSENYILRSSFFIMANQMQPKIPNIPGKEYCCTPDQIFSLPNTPGKTLIYGATPTAIEYAGLLGSMGFPVTVMAPSKIMDEYDGDMVKCIVNNMKYYGVTIIHDCVLTSVKLIKIRTDKKLNQNVKSNESLYKFAWHPLQTRLRRSHKGPRRGRFARHPGLEKVVEDALLEWSVFPAAIDNVWKASPVMRKLEATNGVNRFDDAAHDTKLKEPKKKQTAMKRRFFSKNIVNRHLRRLGQSKAGYKRPRKLLNEGINLKVGQSTIGRNKIIYKNVVGTFVRLFLSLTPDERTMNLLNFNKYKKGHTYNRSYGPYYSYNAKSRVGKYFPGRTAQKPWKRSKKYKYLKPIIQNRNMYSRKISYSVSEPENDIIAHLLQRLKTNRSEPVSAVQYYEKKKNLLEDKDTRAHTSRLIQDYNNQHVDIANTFKSSAIIVDSDGEFSYNSDHKNFEECMVASLENIREACKKILMVSQEIDYKNECFTIISFLKKLLQTIRLFNMYINWKIIQYNLGKHGKKYRKYYCRDSRFPSYYFSDNLVVKLSCKILRQDIFSILIALKSILAFTFASACEDIVEGSKTQYDESDDETYTASSLEIISEKSPKKKRGVQPSARKCHRNRIRNNNEVPFNIPKLYQNRNIQPRMGERIELYSPDFSNKYSRLFLDGIDRSGSNTNYELSTNSYENELMVRINKFEPSSESEKSIEIVPNKSEISENVLPRLQERKANKLCIEQNTRQNVHSNDSCVNKNLMDSSETEQFIEISPIKSDISENVVSRLQEKKAKKLCIKQYTRQNVHSNESFVSKNLMDLREPSPAPLSEGKPITTLRMPGVRSDLNLKEFTEQNKIAPKIVTGRANSTRNISIYYKGSDKKLVSNTKIHQEIMKMQDVEETNSNIPQRPEDNKKKFNFRNFVDIHFGDQYQLKCSLSERNKYLSTLIILADAKAKGFKPIKWQSLASYQKKVGRDRKRFVEYLEQKHEVRLTTRDESYKSDSISERLERSTVQVNQRIEKTDYRESHVNVIESCSASTFGASISTSLDFSSSCRKMSNISSSSPKAKKMEDGVLQTDGASRKYTKKVNLETNESKSLPKKKKYTKPLKNRSTTIFQQSRLYSLDDELKHGIIPLDGWAPMGYQLEQKIQKILEDAKLYTQKLKDLKRYIILQKIVKLFEERERTRIKISNEPRNTKPQLFPGHSVHKVTGKFKNAQDDFNEYFNTIIVAGKQMCPAHDVQYNDVGVSTCPSNGKIYTNSLDQTTVGNIYAIGECVYGWTFENYSNMIAAQYLVRRLFTDFAETPEIQRTVITINSNPLQYAFIGLSEEEAREKYRKVVTYIGSFHSSENLYSLSNKGTLSILKFVCFIEAPQMEKVIGIHLYNEKASFTIQGYVVAMNKGLYYSEVQDLISARHLSSEWILQRSMDRQEYENLLIPDRQTSGDIESNSSSQDEFIYLHEEPESVYHQELKKKEATENWKGEHELKPGCSRRPSSEDDSFRHSGAKSHTDYQGKYRPDIPFKEVTKELEEMENGGFNPLASDSEALSPRSLSVKLYYNKSNKKAKVFKKLSNKTLPVHQQITKIIDYHKTSGIISTTEHEIFQSDSSETVLYSIHSRDEKLSNSGNYSPERRTMSQTSCEKGYTCLDGGPKKTNNNDLDKRRLERASSLQRSSSINASTISPDPLLRTKPHTSGKARDIQGSGNSTSRTKQRIDSDIKNNTTSGQAFKYVIERRRNKGNVSSLERVSSLQRSSSNNASTISPDPSLTKRPHTCGKERDIQGSVNSTTRTKQCIDSVIKKNSTSGQGFKSVIERRRSKGNVSSLEQTSSFQRSSSINASTISPDPSLTKRPHTCGKERDIQGSVNSTTRTKQCIDSVIKKNSTSGQGFKSVIERRRSKGNVSSLEQTSSFQRSSSINASTISADPSVRKKPHTSGKARDIQGSVNSTTRTKQCIDSVIKKNSTSGQGFKSVIERRRSNKGNVSSLEQTSSFQRSSSINASTISADPSVRKKPHTSGKARDIQGSVNSTTRTKQCIDSVIKKNSTSGQGFKSVIERRRSKGNVSSLEQTSSFQRSSSINASTISADPSVRKKPHTSGKARNIQGSVNSATRTKQCIDSVIKKNSASGQGFKSVIERRRSKGNVSSLEQTSSFQRSSSINASTISPDPSLTKRPHTCGKERDIQGSVNSTTRTKQCIDSVIKKNTTSGQGFKSVIERRRNIGNVSSLAQTSSFQRSSSINASTISPDPSLTKRPHTCDKERDIQGSVNSATRTKQCIDSVIKKNSASGQGFKSVIERRRSKGNVSSLEQTSSFQRSSSINASTISPDPSLTKRPHTCGKERDIQGSVNSTTRTKQCIDSVIKKNSTSGLGFKSEIERRRNKGNVSSLERVSSLQRSSSINASTISADPSVRKKPHTSGKARNIQNSTSRTKQTSTKFNNVDDMRFELASSSHRCSAIKETVSPHASLQRKPKHNIRQREIYGSLNSATNTNQRRDSEFDNYPTSSTMKSNEADQTSIKPCQKLNFVQQRTVKWQPSCIISRRNGQQVLSSDKNTMHIENKINEQTCRKENSEHPEAKMPSIFRCNVDRQNYEKSLIPATQTDELESDSSFFNYIPESVCHRELIKEEVLESLKRKQELELQSALSKEDESEEAILEDSNAVLRNNSEAFSTRSLPIIPQIKKKSDSLERLGKPNQIIMLRCRSTLYPKRCSGYNVNRRKRRWAFAEKATQTLFSTRCGWLQICKSFGKVFGGCGCRKRHWRRRRTCSNRIRRGAFVVNPSRTLITDPVNSNLTFNHVIRLVYRRVYSARRSVRRLLRRSENENATRTENADPVDSTFIINRVIQSVTRRMSSARESVRRLIRRRDNAEPTQTKDSKTDSPDCSLLGKQKRLIIASASGQLYVHSRFFSPGTDSQTTDPELITSTCNNSMEIRTPSETEDRIIPGTETIRFSRN